MQDAPHACRTCDIFDVLYFRIRADYHDVSKEFYADPATWLRNEYPNTDHSPTHLVMFNVLLPVSGVGGGG